MTSESCGSRRSRHRPTVALLLAALVPLSLPSRADTPSPAALDLLKVGDVVAPFDAEGIDGEVRHVVYAKGSTTVLLFFLSGCPVCHRMIPEWNRAFERKTKGLQVIGVLMDKEPPGFFMATPISFPVVRAPGADFTRRFKVQRVPMSLRVAPGGRVEDMTLGQVDAIRLGELFRP